MTNKENTMYILSGLYFGKQTAEKYRKQCEEIPPAEIKQKTAEFLQKVDIDAITADIMQGVNDIINRR